MRSNPVYLLLLSGELADANQFISSRYPGCECVVLSKREYRVAGLRNQVRAFRKLQGRALVFFVRSVSEVQEPLLTAWSGVFHRCRLTVIADSTGHFAEYNAWRCVRLLPRTLASALLDLIVFAVAWALILFLRTESRPIPIRTRDDAELDLAYLYPYPLDVALAGGAHSHVKGFLSGTASCGASAEIFSARPLPVERFAVHVIPTNRRLFVFRESLLLSYNLRFALAVRKILRGYRVGALYQRHGRFVVAGLLLSRWLDVPLILEYNGSETWVAKHWDPVRFGLWLNACEEACLSGAHLIVVVSDALRKELLERGVPEEKILMNPNAVDPAVFYPGCGGQEIRGRLNIAATDIVVAFLGTFDRWHGTTALQDAIEQLLQDPGQEMGKTRLTFLLIGEGPLSTGMRNALQRYAGDRVVFTGLVPHAEVPAYLDAADILVSPHVPMPDARPFFGSPTKIFEYMAMAKGIIASDLDQLAQVLQHGRSAWLVPPGSVSELVSATVFLAKNPELRTRLGQNARSSALAEHTWQQNAERVLAYIRPVTSHRMAAPAGV